MLEIAAKTTTPRQMQLNLIPYHFIFNLEIRAWNLYFLNENVLHLNNKNKPFLDENYWFSVTQSCSTFVCQLANRCVCFCENIMFTQIGSHVGVAVHFFGVSSLLFKLVHMYMYIFKKMNKETNVLERKAALHFCFGKTETSAQAGTGLWRSLVAFMVYIRPSCNQSRKAADFSIVLQCK